MASCNTVYFLLTVQQGSARLDRAGTRLLPPPSSRASLSGGTGKGVSRKQSWWLAWPLALSGTAQLCVYYSQLQGRLGTGLSCVQEKGDCEMVMTRTQDPRDTMEVGRFPGYQWQGCFPGKEVWAARSPLALGCQLGGRSGKDRFLWWGVK